MLINITKLTPREVAGACAIEQSLEGFAKPASPAGDARVYPKDYSLCVKDNQVFLEVDNL